MKVACVYLAVVAIWSTTPLFIQMSVDSFDYIQASALRMWLSLALCLVMLRLFSIPLGFSGAALYRYFIGALAITGAMLCVYWSAKTLPSGLIAVVWGLTPLAVSLYSLLMLPNSRISLLQAMCMVLAVFGLYYIFAQGVSIGLHLALALLILMLGVNLHAVSSVWLQRLQLYKPESATHPLAQTTGALLLSAPVYGVMWWLFSGPLPQTISQTSLIGVMYLAVLGSVVGFIGYYFLLNHLSASNVALITLITPVIALGLGAYVANEVLHPRTWVGSAFILLALVGYHHDPILHLVKRCRLILHAKISDSFS